MNHRFSNYVGNVGSALLGKFCPLCYPAIGGFLSAVGLGFTVNAIVIAGLLIILLATGFLGLWRSFKIHKNPWPVRIALPSALFLFTGKYILDATLLFYAGVIGLISAVLWDMLTAKAWSKCSVCKNPNTS